MKLFQLIQISLVLVIFLQCKTETEVSQWRGDSRSGIYNETGLLKEWPEEGPELLWFTEGLPPGFSSVTIANDMIYLTGKSDTMDAVIALDINGKYLWRTDYGRGWNESFPESRSTPTVEGDRLYVSSGMGDVACLNAISGEIIWKVEGSETFDIKFNNWGIAEALIIHDNKVIFNPVGFKTTCVALDKFTGEVLWETESIMDSAAYVSPVLVNYANRQFIINASASNIYAVDVNDGKFLWTYKYYDLVTPEWHPNAPIINCNTPNYYDGHIYVTSGYNHVGALLKLNDDASDVSLVWSDSVLDTHHGNVVILNGFIYGSNWINNGLGNWCCIDFETGKAMYEEEWHNKGSIISAEGMLYCYDERKGNLGLVKPTPDKFEVVSSITIEKGSGPHWAHPTIKDGILYVRHGSAVMAYNIKENK